MAIIVIGGQSRDLGKTSVVAGLIAAIQPVIDRLEREARFWIAPGLRELVLHSAGE